VSISDEIVAVTVGDVCGHGEVAASTMELVRATILRALEDTHVPSAVLAIANPVAASLGSGEGVIVTAVVAFLNHRLQTLTFANAGHPPPLLMTHDRCAFLTQRPADLPLGIFPYHHAADYVVAVPFDALAVFYTDGITEHGYDAVHGEIELAEAARSVFNQLELDHAQAIAQHVLRAERGHDDAAVLALRSVPTQR
jgi:serine phosphatase RsbU (regulator of sigma subunit)